MRRLALALSLLALTTACDMLPSSNKAVDVANLPPLSGRETALLTTGQAAAAQHAPQQAETSYLQAVALSKGHVEAHLALAELYLDTHQPTKARDILERAAIFQPNHVAVNYQLGKLYLQENRAADAVKAFDRGLSTQPDSLDLLSGKGIAHDMLRQHTQAQVAYQHAINSNPKADLAGVRTNLGMSLLLDNKPQRAVDILKPEATKKGASPVTRHNLALAYGMLGRHGEARALVRKELTEEQRQQSLKKLAQYIAQRDDSGKAFVAPVTPVKIQEAK